MGSLAGMLREQGYRVTGSDSHVYPPMSTMLEDLGIDVRTGFSADHLVPTPDLVVIGNAISRGNQKPRPYSRARSRTCRCRKCCAISSSAASARWW